VLGPGESASAKACPGPDLGRRPPRRGEGEGQTLRWRWALPVVPVKGELRSGRLVRAGAARFVGYETLAFDQQFPNVAEADRSRISADRNYSTGTIGLRSFLALPVLVDRVGADIARRLGRRQTLADPGRGPRVDCQPVTLLLYCLC
jgi:hypothetical protein